MVALATWRVVCGCVPTQWPREQPPAGEIDGSHFETVGRDVWLFGFFVFSFVPQNTLFPSRAL